MKTDFNKCTKCMYSAMFVIASAKNEDIPTICKECLSEVTVITTQNPLVTKELTALAV